MARFFPSLTCAVLLAGQALAQEPPSEAQRLREIEAQLEANRRAAEELRDREAAAERAAATLRDRLIDISDSLQEAEARASAIDETLARLAREEAEKMAALATRQRSVSNVLAALQSLERSRPPALAVSPDDATEAAVAAIALAAITPELRNEVDALKAQLADIEVVRAAQGEERLRQQRAETALAERQRLLAEALAEREAAKAKDQQRLRRIADEDAKLAREATNLRDLIARVAARGSTAPVAATTDLIPSGPEMYARLPSSFSEATRILPWPVSGRLVSAFGAPTEGGGRSEDVALVTRPGAVVTAPFHGEIAWAEPFGRLGNVIILDVGENYSLVLIGVSRLDVRRGERVRAGEPLGQMSRDADGRLRLQIRRGNTPVDPKSWLQTPSDAP